MDSRVDLLDPCSAQDGGSGSLARSPRQDRFRDKKQSPACSLLGEVARAGAPSTLFVSLVFSQGHVWGMECYHSDVSTDGTDECVERL